MRNFKGLSKVVDSGLENKVEALIKLCVDSSGTVTIVSDVNLGEINFIRVLPASGVTNFVPFCFGSHQFVAGAVSNDIGLLKHDWSCGNS